MDMLSKQSLYIINRWDVVSDVLEAVRGLRQELTTFLYSLEAELRGQEWWSQDLRFMRYGDASVYITCVSWQVNEEDAVWIGIEGATVENFFGTGPGAKRCVWISGRHSSLRSSLLEAFQGMENEILGDAPNVTGGHVLRHMVRKCLPNEEAGDYLKNVHTETVQFMGEAIELLRSCGSTIEDYIAGPNTQA